MKKIEAINKMKMEASRNAFEARIYEEIASFGLNEGMNKFYRDQAMGKAFGLLDAIWYLDETFNRDAHYETAVEDATKEIFKTTKETIDFDRLYVLAGHMPGSHKRDIEEYWARVRNENQPA